METLGNDCVFSNVKNQLYATIVGTVQFDMHKKMLLPEVI